MSYLTLTTDKMSLDLKATDFPGCCGGLTIYDYDVTFLVSTVPDKHIKDVHIAMYNKIRSLFPDRVLVAMEPIHVETNGWEGGMGDSSREAGASLLVFLQDNKFKCNGWSKGKDARHLGSFSKGAYTIDDVMIPLVGSKSISELTLKVKVQ